MTKTQLIAAVAKRTGMKQKDAEEAVCAVFETIIETLAAGEKVQVAGFGGFTIHEREAHTARNPRSGETVLVPASRACSFSAGKGLKDRLI